MYKCSYVLWLSQSSVLSPPFLIFVLTKTMHVYFSIFLWSEICMQISISFMPAMQVKISFLLECLCICVHMAKWGTEHFFIEVPSNFTYLPKKPPHKIKLSIP